MKSSNLAVCLLSFGLLSYAESATAGPETFETSDTTTINGSDGSTYAAPNNFIGAPFQTTGLTVTQSGSTAVLDYYTAFSGTDTVNSYKVGYADIFFGGLLSGYGISLGDQTGNGGVGKAGLYSATSAASSQQIWGARSGIVYGAGFNGGQTAYTVLTGGTFVQGVTITDTLMGNGLYDLAITISNTPFDVVQAFESGKLTAFWGTGDCANGAFVAVPEPASQAIFLIGAMVIGFVTWRRGASASL